MVFSAPVQAQSLVALYESARAFDASYQSAKLQYEANLARAEQAKAGILPSAGVAVGVSRNRVENTTPAIDSNFTTQNATLSATQPLSFLSSYVWVLCTYDRIYASYLGAAGDAAASAPAK